MSGTIKEVNCSSSRVISFLGNVVLTAAHALRFKRNGKSSRLQPVATIESNGQYPSICLLCHKPC